MFTSFAISKKRAIVCAGKALLAVILHFTVKWLKINFNNVSLHSLRKKSYIILLLSLVAQGGWKPAAA